MFEAMCLKPHAMLRIYVKVIPNRLLSGAVI
ncbi:MAG: hypothetical protein ACI9J2_002130, partial [Saprospiraceae bacterium]